MDHKGRTPLHYAIILNCDKKIVQLLIDFNRELDKYRAHTKEAIDEIKERPIKNFDCIPAPSDVLKNNSPFKSSSGSPSPLKRKSQIKCLNLKELKNMGK
jgi:ankyrin repeat protein